jgi:CBS domain-containing protein
MSTLTKPLFELTATDLMSRQLVTVPRKMSLHGAAHRLAQAQVSGAPVIDEDGRCIGILSATDLVRWLDRGDAPRRQSGCACAEVYAPWQMVDLTELPVDEVERYMTTDLVSVDPATTIGELARLMLDAHIHRVVVLDAGGRPAGMVTTTDVLAAVARCEALEGHLG